MNNAVKIARRATSGALGLVFASTVSLPGRLQADQRQSEHYAIRTETLTPGEPRSSSFHYRHFGASSVFAPGIASTATGGLVALGFPSQLYRPPRAGADLVEAAAGESLKLKLPRLLDNDFDPDDESLTLFSVDTVSDQGIQIQIAGDELLYTAPDPFTAADEIAYVVIDDSGNTGRGRVRIIPGDRELAIGIGIDTNGSLRLSLQGDPEATYAVQFAAELGFPIAWETIGTLQADSGGTSTLPYVPGVPGGFFRIVLLEPSP